MEKIIGGKDINNPFPVRIQHKLLWPCYEFIAQGEGIEDYEKNIIEEVVLKLADINVTDTKEIASCTGLEEDLVSFIQSRLEQRECLDSCYHITELGKQKLGEFSKNRSKEIHVYVDAVSGRIIPYYNMVDSNNRFEYSYGKEEKCYAELDSASKLESENQTESDNTNAKPSDCQTFFKYKGYSTAGTETDEMQVAYKLHYDENFNQVPDSEEVTAMLHKIFPKKDGVFVRIDESQSTKQNLRWILLDVMQPEGSSRDWVFTDGLGKITSFFSSQYIKNETDNKFISSLRDSLQIQTNAQEKSVSQVEIRYPKLKEKLSSAQKCMKELRMIVDSPDKEENLLSAMTDSLLFLTQLAEWVLFYILHEGQSEYKARGVLSELEKFKENRASAFIIAGIAAKTSRRIGFDCGTEEKKSLTQRYGKLWYAFNKVPSLFPLLNIFLIAFENEVWLRDFAKENNDFLSVLTNLNISRNQSFHSGKVGDTKSFIDGTEKAYQKILSLMQVCLGVRIEESQELSFAEKIALQNERDQAISRMEQSLGFTLCHTLDSNLIRFVTDMERRVSQSDSLSNAIVLDQYKILEHLFVSVNESLGDDYKNSDWKAKVRASGFELSETNEFKSILGTNEDRINSALERKPSSMNAACIAFLTLSDAKLLRGISSKWRKMLSDVSYIVHKRGHGEIPTDIDAVRVMEIKRRIIDLIHFFAENGFLIESDF